VDFEVRNATFDGESNMLSCTYPGGRKIGCTYDEVNLKKTITDETDPANSVLIASYGYSGRRVSQRVYGNDTLMTCAYDGTFNQPNDFGVRQIVRTTHTFDPFGPNEAILDDRTYAWDKVYNKTQRADVRAASTGLRLTHDYLYDPAYRMTQATATDTAAPGGPVTVRDTSYTLDGVHNRLSTGGIINGSPDPAAGSYTMNAMPCDNLGNPLVPADGADRELNQYTTTPLDQRTYDANGNLTSLKNDVAGNALTLSVSCRYDYRNRMVEYKDNLTGQRHTYAYDALGRRIAKTVDADVTAYTTRYFYGGESQWQVCEEQDGSGDTVATYVYGRYIDEVLQMQRCESTPPCTSPGGTGVSPVDYYYHTDDLYNVMAVTDGAGQVVERYEYDDYGRPMVMDAAGNALALSDGTALTTSAKNSQITGQRLALGLWFRLGSYIIGPKPGGSAWPTGKGTHSAGKGNHSESVEVSGS